MASLIDIGTLVSRSKQRANAVGGEQIESAEWRELISEVYGELYVAVADTGARYFETEATISLSTFALPTNHLMTIGVDFVLDSADRRRDLAQLMLQERNWFAGVTGPAYMFALVGSTIKLYPTPTTGTYKHLYIAQPTDYSDAASDTEVDVISPAGLRFVLWGVAAIALHRNESAQQRAILERDRALEKVIEAATERAKGMPKRQIVTDIDLASTCDVNGVWNPASWRYR